jgi:hypothetical protein
MTQLKPHADFASIDIGDEIPPFSIGETQETIDNAGTSSRIPNEGPTRKNIHNDPHFAKRGLFAGTVNAGVTTMGYANQMLEACFSPAAFYNGGSLTYKGIGPFRPGDNASFTGKVTGKRTESGKNFVDIEIKIVDDNDRLMGVAEVTVIPES